MADQDTRDVGEREFDLIKQIYASAAELSERTGRPFTPDGHLVGSVGEVLAAWLYDLDLAAASQAGYDAVDGHGRRVQIKASGSGRTFAFYDGDADVRPEVVVALRLRPKPGHAVQVVYAGPYEPVHRYFEEHDRRPAKNGQKSIGGRALARLDEQLGEDERLTTTRQLPVLS